MRRKVKYGGKPIALGEDDDHASAQSLRLALEGDERLIRKRRDGGLPQSQSEKDFLAGKIPRKKKPPKMATASRNFMAVQILEYCRRLGLKDDDAIYRISKACGPRGIHRRKVLEWHKENKDRLGKRAFPLVDAEIKRHGRSKEGLQKMIETMQCFHRISTGEYALDDAG